MALTSCLNEFDLENTSGEVVSPERKVAVKIDTKYVEISQNIPVSEKDTPDFVGAISCQAIRQAPEGMIKSDENTNTPTDDYVDPDDLPIVTEGGTSETIFDDGTYESSTIRRINTALSPIFQLYEVPISYQESVTRVDINNGMMYAYNVSDELLFSQPHQGIDMTDNHDHILHCFNYVEKKIVWSKPGFDYGLLSQLILLDNGDVLRVAHAEMSYVDGNNGNIRWEKRYDETFDEYPGNFDFHPWWTFVHNNRIYQTYINEIIEVRDVNTGKYLGKITYKQKKVDPQVDPLKGEDGFYVSTPTEIIKYPYVNY